MGQGKTWTEAQRRSRIAALERRFRASAPGRKFYEDAEWMRTAYVDRDLSLNRMAVEAGCALRTIARWMKIHDIPIDPTKPQRRVSKGTKLGSDWHSWRGDDIGYSAAHNRVQAAKGRARDHDCQHCGTTAEQWAYDHQDPDERFYTRAKYTIPYSLDVERYFPLCVRCHVNFDNKAALDAVDDVASEAASA